jgi:RNA polymerase sigma-B factor
MAVRKKPELAGRTNEELIHLLQRTNTDLNEDVAALKEEIVRRNIGLVKSIAVKFINSGELLDDLIQAGYIGLLNAVTNFDLARSTRFSTYATYLIQGEIRHYIRDKHSTVRVPQWVQAMNRKIKEVEETLFQKEGRPPTLAELASDLTLTEQQLTALLRGREAMTYVSIDQKRRAADPNPSPPSIEQLVPDSSDLAFDVRMRVLVAIEQLAEIQQQVIRGLFYQGKSQSEVGEELGISQRQVSRIKDRTLEAIKEALPHEKESATGPRGRQA